MIRIDALEGVNINVLSLDSSRWDTLDDAYGPASTMREILRDLTEASQDRYDLYGRLCHQGTVYTASYAAVPHLLVSQAKSTMPSAILISLSASIENARLSGFGPEIPEDISAAYFGALRAVPLMFGRTLAEGRPDDLLCRMILAVTASAAGQNRLSDVIMELTPKLRERFLDQWMYDD